MMAILYKVIYRFITIPIKIPACFSAKIDKLVLKFIGKYKIPKIGKTILMKKNKVRGIHNFKT